MKAILLNLAIILLILADGLNGMVVEVTGEACNSDIRKAKEQALKFAQRDGVEQYIGVLLKSHDLVINGRLMKSVIQTLAISKAKVISKKFSFIGADIKKEIVCVKVKAILELEKKEFYNTEYKLRMVLNKKEFYPGENLVITIYSNKECYPYIFSMDYNKNLYKIFPNEIEPEAKFKGQMVIPTYKMKLEGINLKLVDVVKGTREELLFICTKEKEEALSHPPDDFHEEQLIHILDQIGIENYEMVDEYYEIK